MQARAALGKRLWWQGDRQPFFLGAVTCVVCLAFAQPGWAQSSDANSHNSFRAQHRAADQVPSPPPPMGWNSWNSFANLVNSQIIIKQANAIVSSGMLAAGYGYVSIDEGWWLGNRDAKGNIVVDPQQWPAIEPGEKNGDMANIVKYLHSRGLKAGIYTDAGAFGCSFTGPDIGPPRPNTGSLGHYNQDFVQFARWGFDYVKVDWCGGAKPNLDPAVQYAAVARAIARAGALTGHSLFFSICNWGRQSPWTWAPGIDYVPRDIWRTSGDISNPILEIPRDADKTVDLKNVFTNFDQGMHPEAQHTGYYNDLDMMVLGMRGMSETADRVHMSLWAISAAPLIVGADVTRLTKSEIAILTNSEVLAVNQNPLGLQCIKISGSNSELQVWAKPLARPGSRAVVLLNRTAAASPISVDWSSLGLNSAAKAQVRDLWAHKDLGLYTSRFQVTVPPQDIVMLRISGEDGQEVTYSPSTTRPDAVAKDDTVCKGCVANEGSLVKSDASESFQGIKVSSEATYITMEYRNLSGVPIVAELRANGQIATRVQFPPTSRTQTGMGAIMAEVNFDPATDNTVEISSPCIGKSFSVVSLKVSPW